MNNLATCVVMAARGTHRHDFYSWNLNGTWSMSRMMLTMEGEQDSLLSTTCLLEVCSILS